MARLAYNYNASPSSHVAPRDTRQPPYDSDIDSVLDDHILDTNESIAMSPAAAQEQRRPSFSEAGQIYSPSTEPMLGYPVNGDAAAAGAAHYFFDQDSQHFNHHDVPHPPSFGPTQWHPHNTPGSLTPTAAYDQFPTTYELKNTTFDHSHDPAGPAHPQYYGGLPTEPGALYQPTNAISSSPQSAQDWMSNSSNDHIDLQSMPKHIHLASPSFNPNPPLLRRDGIRKKNARFEIPAERTLRTIDTLINQTTDEHEIKELKQQKRLLRNRQAALDSRQRKKQHTERLEEEKKQTGNVITELEDSLGDMRVRVQELELEKEGMLFAQQRLQNYVDELMLEKEEMIRSHTLETGELRKKNAVLTEQAQKSESISMSAVPSSTGYSTDFSEFDHLTMESSPWDNFSMVNDFGMDPEVKQENSLVAMPKKERSSSKDDDKAATSGLLLMLLLCGAWVASTSTATAPVSIPNMPEDVRVASAAVLENIYKDAGLPSVQPLPTYSANAQRRGSSQSAPRATVPASEYPALSYSSLSTLHHRVIPPSGQQQRDHGYPHSATHYNGIAANDVFDEPNLSTPPRRRNLGEALAAMRQDKQGSTAEIYTRSLMWDEIPANVVRDFARMVDQCNSGTASLNSGEPIG